MNAKMVLHALFNVHACMCVWCVCVCEQGRIQEGVGGGEGVKGAEASFHFWSLLGNMLKIIMNFTLA